MKQEDKPFSFEESLTDDPVETMTEPAPEPPKGGLSFPVVLTIAAFLPLAGFLAGVQYASHTPTPVTSPPVVTPTETESEPEEAVVEIVPIEPVLRTSQPGAVVLSLVTMAETDGTAQEVVINTPDKELVLDRVSPECRLVEDEESEMVANALDIFPRLSETDQVTGMVDCGFWSDGEGYFLLNSYDADIDATTYYTVSVATESCQTAASCTIVGKPRMLHSIQL